MSDPICPNCKGSILECHGFCERKEKSMQEQIAKVIRLNLETDDWGLCMSIAKDVLNLFNIEGFVKVREGDVGEYRTPLQWEDVDWVGLLETVIKSDAYPGTFYRKDIIRFLTTKDDSRIERV